MSGRVTLELPDHWTPEQLLAIYDFLRLASETLWLHHEDVLLEQMIELDRANGHSLLKGGMDDNNFELPFDDPIPF